MKIMETACVSDELCRLLKEEGQILSLGDSRIKRLRDRLSMLTVRVVVLE